MTLPEIQNQNYKKSVLQEKNKKQKKLLREYSRIKNNFMQIKDKIDLNVISQTINELQNE